MKEQQQAQEREMKIPKQKEEEEEEGFVFFCSFLLFCFFPLCHLFRSICSLSLTAERVFVSFEKFGCVVFFFSFLLLFASCLFFFFFSCRTVCLSLLAAVCPVDLWKSGEEKWMAGATGRSSFTHHVLATRRIRANACGSIVSSIQ